MANVVADAMQSARAVALLGPRQAGKSTLAQVLAGGRVPADYLTLDDDPVRSAARADPQGFVAALGRRTVIDEVQRAPDLLLAVKSRLDRDRSPGQFLLTGSANLRRVPGVTDALPGIGAGADRVRDDDGLAGALFETFVATELERQASWSPQPLTFWHYREGEREVDTIVEWPSGEIVGVEVKASATVRARDFTGLAHLPIGWVLACGPVSSCTRARGPCRSAIASGHFPFPGSGGLDDSARRPGWLGWGASGRSGDQADIRSGTEWPHARPSQRCKDVTS